MSIEYVADPRQRLITVTLTVVVEGRMASRVQDRLQKDPLITDGFNELIDMTQMQFPDFGTPIGDLADLVLPESVDRSPCRVALVSHNRQDGLMLAEVIAWRRPQADLRIFDEIDEALAWVNGELDNSQPPAV